MALTAETIPSLLARQTAGHAHEVILRHKQRGIWVSVTWAGLAACVRQIGMGLVRRGLGQGDTIAVLSDTRPEAVQADLAALSIGCISACIGNQDDATRLEQILRDASCRLLFVENEEQLDKILTLRDRCPSLEHIVIFDTKGLHSLNDPMCEDVVDFLAAGKAHDDAQSGLWDELVSAVTITDQAVLLLSNAGSEIDTQVLAHHDVLRLAMQAADRLGQRPGGERMAFLSMSGILERVLGLYVALSSQTVSNYLENAATLLENMREVQPTLLAAPVPIWERFRDRVVNEAAAGTWMQRHLFQWATGSGGGSWIARQLVQRSVRRHMGLARLRIACTGTTPPPPELARWYATLGISLTRLDGLFVSYQSGEQSPQILADEFTCVA